MASASLTFAMRNLVLSRQWQGRLELQPGDFMHSFCVDPDTGSIFVTTTTGAVCRLAADLQVTIVPASFVNWGPAIFMSTGDSTFCGRSTGEWT